jgi:hypothetical protein
MLQIGIRVMVTTLGLYGPNTSSSDYVEIIVVNKVFYKGLYGKICTKDVIDKLWFWNC